MHSLADQPQPHHDAALAALRLSYPQWAIGYEAALHVFTAERHDGPQVRFLAGHDLAELEARLVTATALDVTP